jgi:hypothetical protein
MALSPAQITALQTIWPTLTGESTLQKLSQLNVLKVLGSAQDLPVSTIKNYLQANNKLLTFYSFVLSTPSNPNPQALLAANYLHAIIEGVDGGLFRASTEPQLLPIMSHLADDPRTGINSGDLAALNNATLLPVLWTVNNGWSGQVSLSDLMQAGDLF